MRTVGCSYDYAQFRRYRLSVIDASVDSKRFEYWLCVILASLLPGELFSFDGLWIVVSDSMTQFSDGGAKHGYFRAKKTATAKCQEFWT